MDDEKHVPKCHEHFQATREQHERDHERIRALEAELAARPTDNWWSRWLEATERAEKAEAERDAAFALVEKKVEAIAGWELTKECRWLTAELAKLREARR